MLPRSCLRMALESWPGSHKPNTLVVDRSLRSDCCRSPSVMRDPVCGRLPACLPACVMMLCLSLVRRWPVGQCCTEATPNSQRFWSSGERDARPRRTVVRSSLLSLLALHAQRTSPSINEDRFSPVCAAQHQRSFCSLRTSFLRCLPACLHTYSARIAVSKLFGMRRAVQAPTEMQSSRPA